MTQESKTLASCWITCASAASRFVQSTKKFGILVTLSATPVELQRDGTPKLLFFLPSNSIMFVREEDGAAFLFIGEIKN
jgi:hypothetical protein